MEIQICRVSGYGSIGHSNTLSSHYYVAGLDELGHAVSSVDARVFEGGGRGESRQLDEYIRGMAYDGIWNTTVENMYEPYLIPQDYTA